MNPTVARIITTVVTAVIREIAVQTIRHAPTIASKIVRSKNSKKKADKIIT